jgi:hypothetical protein
VKIPFTPVFLGSAIFLENKNIINTATIYNAIHSKN